VDAKGLLERQAGSNDKYLVLDLLQQYVSSLPLTLKSKQYAYTAVRSFFMHNRAGLPEDPSFQIKAAKQNVLSKMSLDQVRDLVKAANIRDRSIILVKWQSFQDSARIVHVSDNSAEQVVNQIKAGIHPVHLDIPNRKRNQKPYYTYLGQDAVKALVEYFEKERTGGWPKPGEPIWIKKTHNGKSTKFTTSAFNLMWLRLTRRLGLVPKKKGSVGSRYGFYAHDTRDIAKSLLHTHAKSEGFDLDCAEFWMGHTIDPLGYDKFYENEEYVKKQYLIAEKYLNILSVPQASEQVKRQEEEMKKMQERLASLERVFTEKLKINE
jgi:integrase